MTEISKCLCFFERKPLLDNIEFAKTLIRQYKVTNIKFADNYRIDDESEIINFLFVNPIPEFIQDLKQTYNIVLTPCCEK